MARTEFQLSRLLTLIPYVVKHQGVTIDEVCAVFQVDRDELIKDLNLIFMCGMPDYTPADLIEVDIEGEAIYIHMADYFSRPLRFTCYDLIALYLAGRTLSNLLGLEEATTFQSLLTKLKNALPQEEREYVEAADGSIFLHSEHPDQPKLKIIREAIDGHHQVKMTYYSSGRDELTSRRLNPLKLFFSSGNWYVSGWDLRSGEIRLFRVDRIKEIELTAEIFDPGSFGGEATESEPPGVLGRFKGKKAKLKFASTLANWVLEQEIFSDKIINPDGSVTCTLYAENFAWLEKEILRHGKLVQILEPPELRESVLNRVERLIGLYSNR